MTAHAPSGFDAASRAGASRLTRRRLLAGTAIGTVAGCLGRSEAGGRSPDGGAPDLPPPVLGDPDAAVTVEVYEDFSCPHCATFNRDVFPQVQEAYLEPGSIMYEHHDFPIPVDGWSWPVASAARAVQDDQGDAAFFAYAKRLFEHQNDYSLDRLAELAEAVGGDPTAVREAATEETYRPVVAADREAGAQRGVSGTPTVFVNDEQLVGSGFDEIQAAIEAAG